MALAQHDGRSHRITPNTAMPAWTFQVRHELSEKPVYRRINPVSGLPFAIHGTDALRWINVCHIDVDLYNKGLTVAEGLAAVARMQSGGHIPPVTMIAHSGRGVWLLWLLIDMLNPGVRQQVVHGVEHEPWTPQRASRRASAWHAHVRGALADRLEHLGADRNALDAARFAPLPGTVKTAIGVQVEYMMNGEGWAYTLPALAAAIGVTLDDGQEVTTRPTPQLSDQRHSALAVAGKTRLARALAIRDRRPRTSDQDSRRRLRRGMSPPRGFLLRARVEAFGRQRRRRCSARERIWPTMSASADEA